MKKILFCVLLLSLGGCSSLDKYADVVAAVRQKAVEICNFLPTDGSVRSILAVSPDAQNYVVIAEAICQAVKSSSNVQTLVGSPYNTAECPKVNGVCVEGDFVKPEEKK